MKAAEGRNAVLGPPTVTLALHSPPSLCEDPTFVSMLHVMVSLPIAPLRFPTFSHLILATDALPVLLTQEQLSFEASSFTSLLPSFPTL